jgi:hypothetical protein
MYFPPKEQYQGGGARAELSVGQTVTFHAIIEVPPKTGVVVKAEWDFEGAGDYLHVSQIKPESRVTVTTTYAQNLGRVRIAVV